MSSSSIVVQLRLAGQRAFQSGLRDAQGGMRGLGSASKLAGGALGGMAMVAGQGALALAGLGAAGTVMGLKFNASMEQTVIGFETFLGSTKKAKDMVADLQELGVKTPFDVQELAGAGRQFLNMGLNAKDAVDKTRILADAVSAIPSAGPLPEVATVLSQIQSKGQLYAEDFQQLAERGLTSYQKMAGQMGLTTTELREKMKKGAISSGSALTAIYGQWQKQFGGAAEKMSGSFSGQLNNMKESANVTLGAITLPLFNTLKDRVFPAMNEIGQSVREWAEGDGMAGVIDRIGAVSDKVMPHLTAAFAAVKSALGGVAGVLGRVGGEATGTLPFLARAFDAVVGVVAKIGPALDQAGPTISKVMGLIGSGLTKAGPIIQTVFSEVGNVVGDLINAVKPIAPLFSNVIIPLLKGFAIGVIGSVIGVIKLAIPIIKIIATVLGWLGTKAAPLKGVFQAIGMIVGWFVGPAVFGRILTLLPKVGGVFVWLGTRLRFVGTLFSKIQGVIARAVVAIGARLTGGFRAAFGTLLGMLSRVTGTIGTRLIGGLRTAFGAVARFLARIPAAWGSTGRKMAEALVKGIVNIFGKGLAVSMDIGRKVADWLNENTPLGDEIDIPGPIPSFTLPALAAGGTMPFTGRALVGEQGPELVTLKKGMHVTPNDQLRLRAGGGGGGRVHVTSPIYLDRRQIGLAVNEYNADTKARA